MSREAWKLHDAICGRDAVEVERFIRDNPAFLMDGKSLALAIAKGDQKVVRTLFRLIADPSLRFGIKPAAGVVMPGGDPVYAYDYFGGIMPHMQVDSPETVKLLRELGVDLNRSTERRSTMWQQLYYYKGKDGFPCREQVIDALLEAGVSIHPPPSQLNVACSPTRNFASDLLYDSQYYNETSAARLVFLAKRGFDLRPGMRAQEYYDSLPSRHRRLNDEMHEMVRPFQEMVRQAPANFQSCAPYSPGRKEAINIACSGGVLPNLLASVARTGDVAAVQEAVSCMDNFWKKEYRQSVTHAQPMAARSGAVEPSVLAGWAMGGA